MTKPRQSKECLCSREIGFHTIRDPTGQRPCSRCGGLRCNTSDTAMDVNVEMYEHLHDTPSETYYECIDESVLV